MWSSYKTWMVEKVWYGQSVFRWLLWPFSWAYRAAIVLRRHFLLRFREQKPAVLLIVVGNLTTGGVGKTPLVIGLVNHLKGMGYRVGVVSRGYGSTATVFPLLVQLDQEAALAGDEPLLIKKKTLSPVVIAPNREDAVTYLLKHHEVDVIVSDDGLQHHAMGRSMEIVVVDGLRGFGNGLCLPAGPLREPVKRLKDVDFVVVNGGGIKLENAYEMRVTPIGVRKLLDDTLVPLTMLPPRVAAIAGIGHPARFFETLKQLGLTFSAYVFPDHHAFQPADVIVPEKVVVMTEKDAIKCRFFATDDMYYLPIEVTMEEAFWNVFDNYIKRWLV